MKSAKLCKYILYFLLVVCTITAGLFFFGGKVVSETNVQVPIYTGLFLFVLVVVFGAALAVTFLAVITRLAERFRRSPKQGFRSVIGFFVLFFVMLFCWLMGSGNILPISAYSGTYNTPVWLKITDMFLYSTYVLIVAAILLIIGFYIARKIR